MRRTIRNARIGFQTVRKILTSLEKCLASKIRRGNSRPSVTIQLLAPDSFVYTFIEFVHFCVYTYILSVYVHSYFSFHLASLKGSAHFLELFNVKSRFFSVLFFLFFRLFRGADSHNFISGRKDETEDSNSSTFFY